MHDHQQGSILLCRREQCVSSVVLTATNHHVYINNDSRVINILGNRPFKQQGSRSNSENETMEMEKSPQQPLFEFQEVDGTKSTVKVQQGHFKMVIASQFVVTRIKLGSDYVSMLNHHHVLLGSTTNALGFMDLSGTL